MASGVDRARPAEVDRARPSGVDRSRSGGQSSASNVDRARPSGVDRARPPRWTELDPPGWTELGRPQTQWSLSLLRVHFFFCQLSVNEVGGFSDDADVHLNSEVYGKRVGVHCQEHRRCGPCNAALSPGPRPPPGAMCITLSRCWDGERSARVRVTVPPT